MAQKRLKSESLGWAPPTLSSEHALDLQRPESSDTLRGQGAEVFGFPLVRLVIFQENQGLGVLRVWVQVTQSWLHWPCDLYCSKGPTLRRDPTSALPVLKCLIFLEQGVPHFCVPHFHFSLAPTIWVAGPGLPVKC